MKRISQFRFKQFSLWHHRSAMKVGVDGVLIGCWADVAEAHSILDVGTGCGLIALIMAQRQPKAHVVGVDIDLASFEEASENAKASPWSERINMIHGSFPESVASLIAEINGKFDMIVSNPPYFDSGLHDIVTPRERARHQGDLSPYSLLKYSKAFLNLNGSVAMVVPAEFSEKIETYARSLGYTLIAKCLVRGNEGVPIKRALLQWRLYKDVDSKIFTSNTELTLEISPGIPTDEYKSLCKDFYLKF